MSILSLVLHVTQADRLHSKVVMDFDLRILIHPDEFVVLPSEAPNRIYRTNLAPLDRPEGTRMTGEAPTQTDKEQTEAQLLPGGVGRLRRLINQALPICIPEVTQT